MNDNNRSKLKPFSIDLFGGDYWSIYFFTREIEGKIQLCKPNGDPLSDILFDKVGFAGRRESSISTVEKYFSELIKVIVPLL